MLAARRIKLRQLVTAPPRSGKSRLFSKFTPAWWLGTFPDERVMLVSYQGDYAATWGRAARSVVEEWGERLWGIRVTKASSAASRWDIEKYTPATLARLASWDETGGGMNTAGIGGKVVGLGATCWLMDDPVKNQEAAFSSRLRQKAKDWWQSDAVTRQEPGGIEEREPVSFCLMTRFHEDDIGGFLLNQGRTADEDDEFAETWEAVNLPAIAEEDDALGRQPGEALWPQRFPIGRLLARRNTVGPYFWSALYQGHPSPAEGALFKRDMFRYFIAQKVGDQLVYALRSGTPKVILPGEGTILAFADLATSTKTSADYTVITVAQVVGADVIVLACVRERIEGPDIVPYLWAIYNEYHPSLIGMEQVAFQLSAIQEAQRSGLPVEGFKPEGDKWARALTLSTKMGNGQWYIPELAFWRPDAEDELMVFPNGKHDDIVDSWSGLAKLAIERSGPRASMRVLG